PPASSRARDPAPGASAAPRGAADAPGAGSRAREEAGGGREVAIPQGPPSLVRCGRPRPPRETGRPAREGEGAHRIEAKTPDLGPHGRGGGVARPDETRVADGDAPADRLAHTERGKRTDRRAQGVDEAAESPGGTQVGPGQDCQGGPG